MVRDIRFLLSDDQQHDDGTTDVTYLWDNRLGFMKNSRNYGQEVETSEW